MPEWAQWLGSIIPVTHMLRVVRGAMLKGVGIAEALPSLAALALLGAGIAALTRRPAWYGALRQVCLGALAAGFTYAVGIVIGVGAP